MKIIKLIFFACNLIICFTTRNVAQNPIFKLTNSNGIATFIEFEKISTAQMSEKIKIPLNDLEVLKRYLPVSIQDSFKELSFLPDPLGYSHRKYQQYFNGIKVENSVYTIHSKNNSLVAMNGNFTPINNISTTPSFDEQQALKNALKYRPAEVYIWNTSSAKFYYNNDLNIPKGEIVFVEIGGEAKLAYKFDIFALKPLFRENVFVDANNGQILKTNAILKKCFHKPTLIADEEKTTQKEYDNDNSLATIAPKGNFFTRYNGSVTGLTDYINGTYRLRDYSRGQGIETYDIGNLISNDLNFNLNNAKDFIDNDNNWTEYNNSNKDNAALDVHNGTQNFHEYFKTYFGRNSIDGNGLKLRSYVHFLGIEGQYVNAFWTGNEMFYGDGDGVKYDPLTSQDVVAHELAHGFCQFTANLQYERESGALNEALSDIWAAIIEKEFYPNKKTWLIGEDFDLYSKKGFRDMSDPFARNMPKTYLGKNWCWESNYDYGGVHLNSSVINYWFYLLSMGGIGTNDFGISFQVKGIGIFDAAKIIFRTETLYLSPNSQFLDFRVGVLKAATELFGEKSIQVANAILAFAAVGITNELLTAQQNYYANECSIPEYQKNCGFAMTADIVYSSSVFSVSDIIANSSSTLFLTNCNFQFLSDFHVGNVNIAPNSNVILEAGEIILFESQNRSDGLLGGLFVPFGSTFKAQICSSSSKKLNETNVLKEGNYLSQASIEQGVRAEILPATSMKIYPNPSSEIVNINIDLFESAVLNLFIKPLIGPPVAIMNHQAKEAGNYAFSLPVEKLKNGMHLIVLQANGKNITQKLMVFK